MNQYWVLALIISYAAIFGRGERFGENRVRVQCDRQIEAQQQNTIHAVEHVVTEIQTQGKITQETENAYHTGITAIDTLYATAGVQPIPSTGGGVRRVSASTCGTQTTKKYRMTLKQCDQEEAKCNALWNWAQHQAAVK